MRRVGFAITLGQDCEGTRTSVVCEPLCVHTPPVLLAQFYFKLLCAISFCIFAVRWRGFLW